MCGIFGVFNAPGNAAHVAREGIHGLQHRAREYACIVSTDGDNFYHPEGSCRGLALDILSDDVVEKLPGPHALAHVRYSTVSDDPTRKNHQPIEGFHRGRRFALGHNGNLTNADALRREIESHTQLATSMDSELLVKLLELSNKEDMADCLRETLAQVKGSYSLAILFRDRMLAIRSPEGNRPMVLGRYGNAICVSSEDSAIFDINGEVIRDVQPGEMLEITTDGIKPHTLFPPAEPLAKCVFEQIYFASPASTLDGHSVALFRGELGRRLCRTCPAKADAVIPAPDSANYIAVGYALENGTPLELALLRNHYAGRTFIAAKGARKLGVSRKFKVVRPLVEGKDVILVDDSIVRLNTMPKLIELLRRAGVKKVHVRIGSPPNIHPCHYGINTPTREELIASSHTIEEIRKLCGADSLEYLPMRELRAIPKDPDNFCYACMTGKRPPCLH